MQIARPHETEPAPIPGELIPKASVWLEPGITQYEKAHLVIWFDTKIGCEAKRHSRGSKCDLDPKIGFEGVHRVLLDNRH